MVDAGEVADALRAKYADRSRYAIVHGTVRMWVEHVKGRTKLSGSAQDVGVNEINVAKPFRAVWERLAREGYVQDRKTTYDATIAFGKRFEPWIIASSGPAPK